MHRLQRVAGWQFGASQIVASTVFDDFQSDTAEVRRDLATLLLFRKSVTREIFGWGHRGNNAIRWHDPTHDPSPADVHEHDLDPAQATEAVLGGWRNRRS
jgi:hypothetical protein